MQGFGFVHDMLDVKILILFVTVRVKFPLTKQEIYELCFQDDSLSYINVYAAIPEMVESGHLEETEDGRYVITEKGREQEAVTADGLAFTVRRDVETAVERYNSEHRRQNKVSTQLLPRENGEFGVLLQLEDAFGALMKLELMAPNQSQAILMSKRLENCAELMYDLVITSLWDDAQ